MHRRESAFSLRCLKETRAVASFRSGLRRIKQRGQRRERECASGCAARDSPRGEVSRRPAGPRDLRYLPYLPRSAGTPEKEKAPQTSAIKASTLENCRTFLPAASINYSIRISWWSCSDGNHEPRRQQYTPVPQGSIEAAASSGTQAGSSAAPDASTYTPSPELARLLDQVCAQPAVARRSRSGRHRCLHQGYYHSQTSIEQTAQAITQSGD